MTPIALPSETLAAFGGDELRARIFYEKYALRSDDGLTLENTPNQMWLRLASHLANVEASPELQTTWTQRFLWLLSDFRMIPGGRVMAGVGNPRRVTSANCYVLQSPHDSIEGIFRTAHEMAETYKRGGGCGVDISTLRPAKSPVRNAALTSSGAISFMPLYSMVTGTIGQHGRRGALMLTIADTHPDVLAFTRIKRDLTTVRFANISVRVSDALIAAVKADAPWPLHFENSEDGILINQVISARELWHELITGAWGFAEPGALFWDTVLRYSTSEYAGMGAASTNPCSEIPMGANDTCTLANINLAAFCANPFTPEAHLTIDLSQAVRYTVRFLDNLLTYNADHHAFPAQREASLLGRRIGVGFTGLGDLLIQLGLRYDSDKAIAFTDRLFADIKETAYRMSVELAIEKGSFPAFDRDRHLSSRYFKEFPPNLIEAIANHGLRNVALLTVPPVGSGAAMAGVTSGIEPVFAFSYIRRSESLSKETFHVDHPLVQEYRRIHHLAADAPLPPAFVTAHEIDPLKRVMLQATIQKHLDQGISSTINLAHDTTPETVDRIYHAAHAAGLKGITVYRERSREGILLTHGEAAKSSPEKLTVLLTQALNRLAGTVLPTDTKLSEPPTEAELATLNLAIDQATATGPTQLQLLGTTPALIPRPPMLHGTTMAQPAPEGNLQITINEVNGDPFELIAHGGKAGSDILAWVQALARTASVLLRLQRLPSQAERLELLIEQWRDIAGSRSIGFGPDKVRSGPDGIAQALQRYLALKRPEIQDIAEPLSTPAQLAVFPVTNGNCCPNCRSFSLVLDEGCLRCTECGFKEC